MRYKIFIFCLFIYSCTSPKVKDENEKTNFIEAPNIEIDSNAYIEVNVGVRITRIEERV